MVKVHKFIKCLSAEVHVVQYVKLSYVNLHKFLKL